MKAGETVKFYVEWDWNHADETVAKDWSLVAWGSSGELTVGNYDGSESDTLPFTARLDKDMCDGATAEPTESDEEENGESVDLDIVEQNINAENREKFIGEAE